MKNQTKLWQQEQKTLEEYKQIKQREQELAKEQEAQELLALKSKHNQLTAQDKLKLSKLDWMYDAPVPVEAKPEPTTKPTKATKPVNNIDKMDPMRNLDPMRSMDSRRMDPMGGLSGPMRREEKKDHRDLDPMLKMRRETDSHRKRDRSPRRTDERHRHHRHRHHKHSRSESRDKESRKQRDESRTTESGPESDSKAKPKLQY